MLPNLSTNGRAGVVRIGDASFLLSQAGFDCSFRISPANRTHGFALATNTFEVTTTANCAWSVFNTNSWITITAGASGAGSSEVTYTVAPNLGAGVRTGVVVVGGATLTMTQNGATNFGFEVITVPEAGQVRLKLSGAPAGVWEVQGSQDLEHWSRIGKVTNVTGVIEYLDRSATNLNQRFYRAVMP